MIIPTTPEGLKKWGKDYALNEVLPNFWTIKYPDFIHAATSLDNPP